MTRDSDGTRLGVGVESSTRPSPSSWLAWMALSTFTLLNANSIAVLAGASERLFNPILLGCALYVIFATRAEARGLARPPLPAVWVFAVTFLLVGMFSATGSRAVSLEAATAEVPLYLASLVLVIAAAQMSIAAERAGQTDYLLLSLFVPLLLASVSGALFVAVPAFGARLEIQPGERLHGVFGNVNELGAQAGFAIVIGLVLAMRRKQVGWFLVGLAATLVGAVSSFSKSAMLGVLPLLVLAIYAAAGARLRLRTVMLLAVGGAALTTVVFVVLGMLLDGSLGVTLTSDQALRLSALIDIISSGALDETATTGRSSIWMRAIAEWRGSPVLGLGIGAFDRVRGVDMEVHSTLLRVLGESGAVGFFTFLVMSAALLVAIQRVHRRDVHVLGLGFALVQLPAIISLGYILVSRNHNVLTGCVLGLLASVARDPSHVDVHPLVPSAPAVARSA